jgi:hypothetical protein
VIKTPVPIRAITIKGTKPSGKFSDGKFLKISKLPGKDQIEVKNSNPKTAIIREMIEKEINP